MRHAKQNLIAMFYERPPSLEGNLDVALEPVDERRGWLRVSGAGHSYEARAAALAVPYPSGLTRLIAANPGVEAVLVEHASPGFDAAAADQGIDYLDLRGRGRLIGPGFVYVAPPRAGSSRAKAAIEDPALSDDPWLRPAGRRKAPPRASPFAPKASRVVRALLSGQRPGAGWMVSELAHACRMNPGNVHRILGALIDDGFIERDRDLYVLSDPGSLLEAWAENADRRRDPLSIPVKGDLRAAVDRLMHGLEGPAFVSGELAAELYAPHLQAKQAIVHAAGARFLDEERLLAEAGPPPLRADAVVVVDRADEGVGDFGEARAGLPLVSPVQLYVDLARAPGRGREAAAHVRRVVLGF
jgi:hypothetical protein